MKVLHLATLVSPDGAYGGPLRVALNQAAELRRRGHDVHIAAGWQGGAEVPRHLDGTPTHLFPVRRVVRSRGHSGMVSVGLFRWLTAHIGAYDIVHIHAGRDLISNASMGVAYLKRRPYLVQTHGMVPPDARPITRFMDVLLTRRLLRSASKRFVLTEREASDLKSVLSPETTTEHLPNGVPQASVVAQPGPRREVLFCARLHRRKRPVDFVEVAAELTRRGIRATYALVGPDEGELTAVLSTIEERNLQDIVHYDGALDYDEVLERMSRATVYILPSVDEPFGMSLLEALSLGIPSICTSSCGLAGILREQRAALVTGESVVEMADGVQKILRDESLNRELSLNGKRAVADLFSMKAVGDQLEKAYADVLEAQGNSASLSET